MKLFYYQDARGNFGDDLNAWLWPQLIPEVVADDSQALFLGIGSILGKRMQIPEWPLKAVFGTGVGYGEPPVLDARWRVYCVRGPLTARALHLPDDYAVTDAAALISLVVRKGENKASRAIFVPHHRSVLRARIQGIDFAGICSELGIGYIDPGAGVEFVLEAIRHSELVIAEAMHAAIVADSLRIPWVPVRLYDHILEFKWLDWCRSLDLTCRAVSWRSGRCQPGGAVVRSILRDAAVGHRGNLSKLEVFEDAVSTLRNRLNHFVEEWRSGYFQDHPTVEHEARLGTRETGMALPSDGADRERRESPALVDGDTEGWEKKVLLSVQEVDAVLPKDGILVLIDQDEWMSDGMVAGRRAIPFLAQDGAYGGAPADDDVAISELEADRSEGSQYLVVAWSCFWWMDHYPSFINYVHAKYTCILENERLVIFDLRNSRQ